MSEIKNRKFLKESIMEQSRHQLLYGYNGKNREEFLRDMVKDYPVILDSSNPIGIYLDSIGLPKIPQTIDGLDKIALSAFAREYLGFSIVNSLLDTTIEQVEIKDLNERSIELIYRINRLCVDDGTLYAKNLRELRDILNDVRYAYLTEYEKYAKSGDLNNFILNLPIKFINLEMFIRYYKQMINTKSYIGIVVDHQNPIAIKSQQAINGLVASRINADISMKVACEPDAWESFVDLNGNTVDAIHDYGTTELDGSYPEYMKKLKR